MSDSEKILMKSVRQITNDCLPLKSFVFSHYGKKKHGPWKSGAFLNLLSVYTNLVPLSHLLLLAFVVVQGSLSLNWS